MFVDEPTPYSFASPIGVLARGTNKGSHSYTCYPIEETFLALLQPKLVLNLSTQRQGLMSTLALFPRMFARNYTVYQVSGSAAVAVRPDLTDASELPAEVETSWSFPTDATSCSTVVSCKIDSNNLGKIYRLV